MARGQPDCAGRARSAGHMPLRSPQRCAGKSREAAGQPGTVIESLETLPQRGHCPPELERIGMMEYREVFFKPYRVIYRIAGREVRVYAVLDGRRDLPDLLQERILR